MFQLQSAFQTERAKLELPWRKDSEKYCVANTVLHLSFLSFSPSRLAVISVLFSPFLGQHSAISTKHDCAIFKGVTVKAWDMNYFVYLETCRLELHSHFFFFFSWPKIRKMPPCTREPFLAILVLEWGGVAKFTISSPFVPSFWFYFPCKDASTLHCIFVDLSGTA